MISRFLALGTWAFLNLAITNRSQAEDRYFMVMFASQGQPNLPKLSHTFAAFIKTSGQQDLKHDKVEVHTISWMPASLVLVPLRLQLEVGKNLDLAATLAYAKSLNAPVTSWGPFAVKKELYDRAVKQIDLLSSGKIAFIVLDRRFRGKGASNCIHAVCDVDTDNGFVQTGSVHGIPASQAALEHLDRWVIPTKEDLGVLYERLRLPKEVERMVSAQKGLTR
jgi:hypothetical protein